MKVKDTPVEIVHKKHIKQEIQNAISEILDKYGLVVKANEFDDFDQYYLAKTSPEQKHFALFIDEIFSEL